MVWIDGVITKNTPAIIHKWLCGNVRCLIYRTLISQAQHLALPWSKRLFEVSVEYSIDWDAELIEASFYISVNCPLA